MKHIRKFESYRLNKQMLEVIHEAVIQVNDTYKVQTFIDIPQSLINSYVKKVKDMSNKNLRTFMGDQQIAEEIVKYINATFLDSEKIPANAIIGGSQTQAQGQAQVQAQGQIAPQGQAQVQAQAPQAQMPQMQAQPQVQDQGQAQAQPAVQGQPQVQVQGQPQMQAQPQAQSQGQAQDEDDEFEEIADDMEDEDEDELPL